MDFVLIHGWINVMGGHRCNGIKGEVQIVNHGIRLVSEGPLRSRLIDWEEIQSELGGWVSLKNRSGQSEA